MKFKELEKKVIQWGIDRNLFDPEHGGSALTQLHKFYEEFGELNQAILKKDSEGIKDAIGDCQVCLINRAMFLNYELNYDILDDTIDTANAGFVESFKRASKKEQNDTIEVLLELIVTKSFFGITRSIHFLEILGMIYGFTLFEGLEFAYNEIKDRKGKLINGTFVKEK